MGTCLLVELRVGIRKMKERMRKILVMIAAAALWSNEAVSADFDVDLRTARIEASAPLNESVRSGVRCHDSVFYA